MCPGPKKPPRCAGARKRLFSLLEAHHILAISTTPFAQAAAYFSSSLFPWRCRCCLLNADAHSTSQRRSFLCGSSSSLFAAHRMSSGRQCRGRGFCCAHKTWPVLMLSRGEKHLHGAAPSLCAGNLREKDSRHFARRRRSGGVKKQGRRGGEIAHFASFCDLGKKCPEWGRGSE